MILEDMLFLDRHLRTDIGPIEFRFSMEINRSKLAIYVSSFKTIAESGVSQLELKMLLSKNIKVDLEYISIEDIPDDITDLSPEEQSAIFKFVRS